MNWWKWLMLVLSLAILVIVIVILVRMRCPPPDEGISMHVAKRLEAHPHQVQVDGGVASASRSFQELTWYRDQYDSAMAGRFLPRHWYFSPAGEGAVLEGWINGGLVSVTTFPTTPSPSKASVKVTSWFGSLSDQMEITRWTSPSAATTSGGGSDVVTATYDPGQMPNVVLLEEATAAGCKWGTPVAFVGAATVGEQTMTPCSTTLLSSSHPAAFDIPAATSPWPLPKQQIHLGSNAGPLSLPVYVHIAVTERSASALSGVRLNESDPLVEEVAQSARAHAELDVAWANRILHANRIGITLVPTFDRIIPEVGEDLQETVGADPINCSSPRVKLQTRGFYHPSTLNVYYVDWIPGPPPDNPRYPRRGLECGPDQGEATPVIYVSFTAHSSTSLVHELGHAFTLLHVCGKTAEPCVPGGLLATLNVMFAEAPDGALGADARSHFTIGQAFWSNVHDASWINLATGVRSGGNTRDCKVASCPPPSMDLQ